MKQNSIVFLTLATVALTAGYAVPLLASETYRPLAPISFTIPGDSFDCEALLAELTRQRQADKSKKDQLDKYIAAKNAYATTCKTSLPQYLRGIYYGGVILAGFFAVFSIVRGGFTLLFTDSILGHSEAKGQILRALGGLVIVYSSYLLMNTINPQLGKDLNLSLDFPRFVGCPEGYIPKANERCLDTGLFSNFLDRTFWGTEGTNSLSTEMNKKLLAEQLKKFDKALGERHTAETEAIAGLMTQAAQKAQAARVETDPVKVQQLNDEAKRLTTDAQVRYAKLLGSEQLKLARNETLLQSDGRIDQSKVDGTLYRLATARQEYGRAITALTAAGESVKAAELVDQRTNDLMAANQRIAENYITASKNRGGFTGAQFNAFGDQVRSITNEKDQALGLLNTLKNRYPAGSSELTAIEGKITTTSNRYNGIVCNLRRLCKDEVAYCPQLPPPVGCI